MKTSEEAILAPFFESSGMVDLVGKESKIVGNLVTGHIVRIDGTVEGKVIGEEVDKTTVIVGRTGRVKGDIIAGQVIVTGHVRGTINASKKIRIGHNGTLYGTMESPKIIIEKGAFILGDFEMEIPQDNPLHSL